MRGEVRIRIDGWMPEKVIQRALDQGIRFTSVQRPEPHVLIVETSGRDAGNLLELCGRFSIPAEVLDRRGGSALSLWLRSRWTLLPGILLGIILCALFLGRIWLIDVSFAGEASELGEADFILAQLAEMNIHPGMTRRIDIEALSEELAARAEGYSFAAMRLEGVRLLVEAAPEVSAPKLYSVEEARNLYAACSGIVVSVNVEAGEPCVKPGDTVFPGQLLIRGEERKGQEGKRAISALGEVAVRTWYEGHAEGSLLKAQLRYTGRRSTAETLALPWMRLSLIEGEHYRQQSVEILRIPVGGLYLPVSIDRENRRETESVIERGDREMLSSRLTALSMADARCALGACGPEKYDILRSWIRYTTVGSDALRAYAVYEIITNAAVTRSEIPKGG